MKIYKLNNKQIGKEIRNFNKTTYGQIMMLLSYSVFLVSLILLIMSLYIIKCTCGTMVGFPVTMFVAILLITVISFVVGSINYYKELRMFVENKK